MRVLTLAVALCLCAMVVNAEEKTAAETGEMKAKPAAESMGMHDMKKHDMDTMKMHGMNKMDKKTSMTKEDEATAKPVGNTVCPVSGEKIGSMGEPASIVYKGHKVALCCNGCRKTFSKDPEKYLLKAEKQAAMVSGKKGEEMKSDEQKKM